MSGYSSNTSSIGATQGKSTPNFIIRTEALQMPAPKKDAVRQQKILHQAPTSSLHEATSQTSGKQLLQQIIKNQSHMQQQLTDLLNAQALHDRRYKKLAESIASIASQQSIILKAIDKRGGRQNLKQFHFDQIGNEAQLVHLEERLTKPEFREDMIQWLEHNISDKSSYKRMFRCIDLIFTRRFQLNCSWTGVSRTVNEKSRISNRHNLIALFKTIGTTNAVKVTDQQIAAFFKQKLKNVGRVVQQVTAKQRRNTASTILRSASIENVKQSLKMEDPMSISYEES